MPSLQINHSMYLCVHFLSRWYCNSVNICLILNRNYHIYIIVKFYLFQLIYQIFYKKTASGDRGSLCQLRNFIGRIDVHGSEEVVQKYRYDKFSILKKCFYVYLHSVEQYVYCTFFMIVFVGPTIHLLMIVWMPTLWQHVYTSWICQT